jgi:hypothetical protein
MKKPKAKLPDTTQAPVFPQTLHHVRTRGETSPPTPKAPKRDKIFSKSRDTHEDRGERQAKNTNNPQTLSRGR